ncbi:MAG: cpaE [Caulobacteraceae bacterium]|nr:cpaE [Caulobacteraceae bacterium]
MLKPVPTPDIELIIGRRVFAFGDSLAPLADGPLAGADLGVAELGDLPQIPLTARDLVIIDADAWDAPALAAAVQLLAGLAAPPAVLTVGAHLPAALVRSMMRLKRSDVLESPYTDEEILQAVLGLAAAGPAPISTPGEEGRCWAVSGAVGGSGATTIAIEMATALAARSGKDRSVCLIDLNLVDGAAASYLGVAAAMRLSPFAHGADRIDASMLQAFVTPVTRQLDLLAAPRDPNGFDTVSREAVLRVMEVACETYAWVIVDMPRHRRAWTLEALAGCDEVLVISELTVPALLAARELADEVEHALGAGRKPKIVLNRLAAKMFGAAPSMAEAERALQRKAEAGVSSDWEAAAASANLGGPIATHRPKSKIVKDVRDLVERLAAQPARQASHARAA